MASRPISTLFVTKSVPCHKIGRTALILLHLKPAGLSTAFNRHEQAGQGPLCQVKPHAHITQESTQVWHHFPGRMPWRGVRQGQQHQVLTLLCGTLWALVSQVPSPGRAGECRGCGTL
jgi:hypothetical protein